MPLPRDAFKFRGGCNCRAIRYEVSVPDWMARPKTPYRTPGADIGDQRLPAIFIDHCNDCRQASGQVLPVGMMTEINTVKTSLLPRNNDEGGLFDVEDSQRHFLSAAEVFNGTGRHTEDTFLGLYKSTPKRSRWFCSRCGTMLAYTVDPGVVPPDWGWPVMLDIWLGTVDREDLEQDYMRPERMFWCDRGIPWIRQLSQIGAGAIPEHPLTKIDKVVGDDSSGDTGKMEAWDSVAQK